MTRPWATNVDAVFFNGPILTMDDRFADAEAVVLAGGRIALVGARADADRLVGADTEVIDLDGRALLPGFTDNHVHLTEAGLDRHGVDLTPQAVRSIDDIRGKIQQAAATTPADEWIIGWGFDHHRLRERRYPTRHDLDDVSPQHPVALRHVESMSWTANTVGLRRMGIRDDTPDPRGGPMLRDQAGAPLGPMWDNCRVEFVFPALPAPTVDDLVDGFTWVIRRLNAVGITSVNDAAVTSRDQLAAYQRLRDTAGLNARVYLNLYAAYGDAWDTGSVAFDLFRSGLSTGYGDDWLRIGPVVTGVDGGVQGQTAALHEPYSNREDGFAGSFRVTLDFLHEFCREAIRRRFQIALVVHGDRGLEAALDALAAAADGRRGVPLRHRLEHAYLWSPELIDRAANLDVVYSGQPPVLDRLGRACTTEPWGKRSRWAFPYRSVLDAGIVASGGSDWPVVTPDPLVGLHALVTRRMTIDDDAPQVGMPEAIRIEEALRVYTAHGAYGDFAEDRWGSITPGKLADLAVFNADPRAVPADRLPSDLRVEMTFVEGRKVYAADGSAP